MLSKINVRVVVYLVAIVAITLAIYYPSFAHLFRGETYVYFMDTQGDNDIVSLIVKWYDYSYVRVYHAGDVLLFRPLLFVVIGFEKAVFGYNYIGWHVTAYVMHLIAVLCLFRLLWSIKSGILAFSATLLFATAYVVLSAVLYEQIVPVSLFTALLLSTLYYVRQGINEENNKKLYIGCSCLVLACLFYEIGMVFAILISAYIWYERKKLGGRWVKWSGLYLVAIPIYLAMYLPPRIINPRPSLGVEFGNIFNIEGILSGIQSSYNIANTWVAETILPIIYNLEPVDRIYGWSVKITTGITSSAINYVVPIIISVGLAIGIALEGNKKFVSHLLIVLKNPYFILLLCIVIIYVIGVSIYRVAPRSEYAVLGKNFHSYIFLGLLVAVSYILVANLVRNNIDIGVALSIVLISLSLLSAVKVFNINREILENEIPIKSYFSQIEYFIGAHQYEKDFSLYATTNSPMQDNLEFDLSYRSLDSEIRERLYLTVPQVLYWDYWNQDSPKYSLFYNTDNDRLELVTK